jgi:pilus assembly protein Flp/PilA
VVQLFAFVASYVASFKGESEEGQGMVEYALIIALVSVVAITVLTALGTGITGTLQSVVDEL